MFRFLRKGSQVELEERNWPSIVFLLRDQVLPNSCQAIEMAAKAWSPAGIPELIGTVGPNNFVIRVGPLTFALHAAECRYEIDSLGFSAVQQQCWDLHNAWLSVDLPGKDVEELRQIGQLGGAFLSLMYFVHAHWSSNCVALYFPSEGATLPNKGELIESIRAARRSGVDLDFLKQKKA